MSGEPSIESLRFFQDVYDVVRRIPEGKVTTYGQIARILNRPHHSRLVGSALRHLNQPDVPWWRVVNHKGVISPRFPESSCRRQAELLRQEGVEVDAALPLDGWEEFGGVVEGGRVSLRLYQWEQ